MKKEEKIKVAVYLRVGRKDRDEEVIENHKVRLATYAEKNFWDYDIFSETGGGQELKDKPALLQLLETIKTTNQYDAILVMHYDRLVGRNRNDAMFILQTLIDNEVMIATPGQSYHPKTDLQVAMTMDKRGV